MGYGRWQMAEWQNNGKEIFSHKKDFQKRKRKKELMEQRYNYTFVFFFFPFLSFTQPF